MEFPVTLFDVFKCLVMFDDKSNIADTVAVSALSADKPLKRGDIDRRSRGVNSETMWTITRLAF